MPLPPRLPISERLRRAGVGAWSILGVLLVLFVAFKGLLYIRVIFAPIGLAILIIFLLNPLITRLEARGVPRSVGTLLAYIVMIGSVTLFLIVTIPYVAKQVETFSDQWPEFRDKTVTFIDDAAASLEDRFDIEIDTTTVDCLLSSENAPSEQRCDEVSKELRDSFTDHFGNFTEIGRSLLEIILVFVLAPLIALYVLIDLPQLKRDLLNLIPETHREEMSDLGTKIHRTFAGFLRGQLLVALFVGVASAIGFRIIGLPFWLMIGAIAGFFNLVPLVGPFIGGGLGFLVGTVSGGVGLGVQAAIVELVVQQLDNHVISPNVMRRTVQLHPATVMLALLAGGALAGFWGVFLGVPAVAVTKLLIGHLWITRVLGDQPTPYARSRKAGADGPPDLPEPPSVTPGETSSS
jgi:predicted PurR-regulated permease PerM